MRALLVSVLLACSVTALAADVAITMERRQEVLSFHGTIRNNGPDAATALRVRITNVSNHYWDIESGLRGWACSAAPGVIECTRDTLAAGEESAYALWLRGSGFTPGHNILIAEVSAANDPDATNNRVERRYTFGRGWTIGDGSNTTLAGAIEQANELCDDVELPCSIHFWFHPELLPQQVTLRAPLPVVTACNLSIFAPPRPTGFFPPQSWSIVGSEIQGEGLVFRPRCEGARIGVEGVAVSGFRGDAIVVLGGANATASFTRLAISGRSRGIAVDAPNTEVRITDTTISGTGRAAVTLWSARNSVLSNVVLRGSGASGLFVGPNGGTVLVRNSESSGHRHFGLAVARGNNSLALENTRSFGNLAMDLDHGLDGPTDLAPLILSATYDAARNVTRVTVDPRGSGRIELWSSDGLTIFTTAHMEHFSGGAEIPSNPSPVTIEVPAPLRGRFLSAVRVEGQRVSEPGPATAVR